MTKLGQGFNLWEIKDICWKIDPTGVSQNTTYPGLNNRLINN